MGEVRTEPLDLSYGEIVNLHKTSELIVQPEYQRLFRWSDEQKSRLIESILLELPIPQIFVVENDNGVYELIDGLQRISSVFQFIESSVIDMDPLVLSGCDIITELNGRSFADLEMTLRLRLKRSTVRTIVIKRQSNSMLRYEMFKRLNTGGELLSPQEIRNCSARLFGEGGSNFYSYIKELSDDEHFKFTTQTLAQEEFDRKTNEELVLRYFAAKNARDAYKGNIRDWLDDYMENILLNKVEFDLDTERNIFKELFKEIALKLGQSAFVKYRDNKSVGGLAPAYFEAVSIGCLLALADLKEKDSDTIRNAITTLVQSNDFRSVTGPGANNKTKLEKRVELATSAIKNA